MIRKIKVSIFILLSYFLIFGQTIALAQSTAAILPQGKTQFLDNNGNPLSSGKVFFYIPNTTTLKTTWQDSAKTIANANPVVLDAGGRAIIYGDGTYRQIVKTSGNSTIFDAVTASAGSGGGTTGTGDGDLVGTIKPWAGLVAPNQYAFAYGQEVSRTTYSVLFTAITLSQNITCSSGSPTASGFSDTSQIPTGAIIESLCFAPATTVLSKTATTVTFSANSAISTTDTAKIFLYGNGNGSTTFNLPDLRGYVIAGRTNMGGTTATNLTSTGLGVNPAAIGAKGGSQTKTLLTSNLPAYTPAGTVSAPSINVTNVFSTSGTNAYQPQGNVSAPTITVNAAGTPLVNIGGATWASGANGGTAAITATASTPSFTGVSVTLSTAASLASLPIFTGTAQGGTSTAFSIVQPTQTLNYIIKITPDSNSADASGVTSLGGMTGDISCGSGLLCTGNSISVVPSLGVITGGTLGQIIIKNSSVNFAASYLNDNKFNISSDPLTDCTGAVSSSTAFSNAFTNFNKILIPQGCTIKLSANYTIPNGKVLIVANGGFVNVDSTFTLTVLGVVNAGEYKIFNGVGTVTGIRQVLPEWWGAVQIQLTNSSVLIGTGSKSFTLLNTGPISFTIGGAVRITNQADLTKYMVGTITSYTPGTGVFVANITSVNGAGTVAGWYIQTDSQPGLQAAVNSTTTSSLSDGDRPKVTTACGDGYYIMATWVLKPDVNNSLEWAGCGTGLFQGRIITSQNEAGFTTSRAVRVAPQVGQLGLMNFYFHDFGIVSETGQSSMTGLAIGSGGAAGAGVSGINLNLMDNYAIQGFLVGQYFVATRLVKMTRAGIYLPTTTANAVGILYDHEANGQLSGDMSMADSQIVCIGNAGLNHRAIRIRSAQDPTSGMNGFRFSTGLIWYHCDTALVLEAANGSSIGDLWVDQTQFDGVYGTAIIATTTGASLAGDFHFTNNYFQGVASNGIALSATTPGAIREVIISNNWFNGFGASPIFSDGGSGLVITNNKFGDVGPVTSGNSAAIDLRNTIGVVEGGNNYRGATVVTNVINNSGTSDKFCLFGSQAYDYFSGNYSNAAVAKTTCNTK